MQVRNLRAFARPTAKEEKDMKKSLRALIALLCLGALLVTVALAAGTYTKTLTAYYQNIKLTINGQTVEPKDVNGNVVDPYIVDGTTYLPVRAVSEALGKQVDWDGDTNTVLISDQPMTGTWKAVKISNSGFNTSLKESFPAGYTIVLNRDGTGTETIDGNPEPITWKEDNGALSIIDEGNYAWYGTITDNVMVLNIEGTFVTLTK